MSQSYREQIITAWPLDKYLALAGIELTQDGHEMACLCPFHADKSPSMKVDLDKKVWNCFPCDIGGSVIDLDMRLKGGTVKDTMARLADLAGIEQPENQQVSYVYRDNLGRPVMTVKRIDQPGGKKQFVQYQHQGDKLIKGVKGVERVLYKLDRWAGDLVVALAEGEKCVAALESVAIKATTNPGGSSAWLDAYAVYLHDKHVDIWPDNDEPGQKWLNDVLKSVEGRVESIRICRVPAEYNDVADFIAAKGALAGDAIDRIMAESTKVRRGVFMNLYSAEDCKRLLLERTKLLQKSGYAINWDKFLGSSFSRSVKPLLPGDLGVILGDTGIGKTTLLTQFIISQAPMPTIFFQLELTVEDVAERFLQNILQAPADKVAEKLLSDYASVKVDGFSHCYTCPQSQLTVNEMEQIIDRSELLMQERPRLVVIDYVGLMGDSASKRYERLSNVSENLKKLAKKTNTVIIMASQVGRDKERSSKKGLLQLHDAKDSGSIENSAQLVLGFNRPDRSEYSVIIEILKQNRGPCGDRFEFLFDGDKQKLEPKYEVSYFHKEVRDERDEE